LPRVVPGYKEQARARIREAAAQAFSEKGYRQTTMDDIAVRMGVTKGAIYVYFKSKEELFAEVCKFGLDSLSELLSSFNEGNVLTGSKGFYEKIRKKESVSPALEFELFAEAPRNPKIRRILDSNYKGALKLLEAFIEDKKKKHLLRDDVDTHALALLLIAVYEGLKVHILTGVDRPEIENSWYLFVEAMLTKIVRTD
jgi:AcrR family transcriptional regulator